MKKFIETFVICSTVAFATFIPVCANDLETSRIEVSANLESNYKLVINGENVDSNQEIYTFKKHIMVPVRLVAEKLGFKIEWNESEQSISLDNGIVKTSITIGIDSYYMSSSFAIGMSTPTPIGVAPTIKGSVTYVPVDMFKILLGEDNVKIDNNVININVDDVDDIIVIDDGYTQIPNPFVEYDSIENAKKAISFDFVYPTKLPDGYKIDTISTMEDSFIQIFYKNGEKEINYRMALGNDDISGDYNVYKNIEKININDLDVTVRKNDDTLSAIWTKGDNTFSIFSNDKISQEELIEIISSIQ